MTDIFRNYLVQRRREQLPLEYFQIFLNVPRFRLWEIHDPLEEGLEARAVFGNCDGPEAFEVSPDAVLLFNLEAGVNELLEQVDDVHGSDEELLCLLALHA